MKKYFPLIFLLLAIRLYTLQFPALMDPTEARYASIAQHIVQTGNWLTPAINRGDGFFPFRGKPPLHFWLTAISFKIFGFNEFAARLPSFFAAVGVTSLAAYTSYILFGQLAALLSFLVLISSPIFNIFFGTSIIDTTLTFFVSLCCACFAKIVLTKDSRNNSFFDILFFSSLALGFITKGPIALALVFIPIIIWSILTSDYSFLLRFRLIRGAIIFILICAPWFLLAEIKDPGLIKYFFINENFLRFISPHYEDLYGTAHRTFRTAIIPLAFAAYLPWVFLIFLYKKMLPSFDNSEKKSLLFCLLWWLAPVIFFSISNNVLITYTLPGFCGFAVTISALLTKKDYFNKTFKFLLIPLSMIFFVLSLGYLIFTYNKSDTWLIIYSIPLLIISLTFIILPTNECTIKKSIKYSSILFSVTLLVLVTLSSVLSDTLSTKNILVKLGEETKNTNLHFRDKLPYSAQFYSYREPNNTLLELLGNNEIVTHGEIILKRNKVSKEITLLPKIPDYQTQTWSAWDISDK
jgi:4-amino-4-deoxy-L-arabinose transferase-like glycosyltransferase